MISIRNNTLKWVDIFFNGFSGDISPTQVGGLVPAVDAFSASPAAPPPPSLLVAWVGMRVTAAADASRLSIVTTVVIPAAADPAAAAAAAPVVRAALPSENI
jgi:hypothetical protein